MGKRGFYIKMRTRVLRKGRTFFFCAGLALFTGSEAAGRPEESGHSESFVYRRSERHPGMMEVELTGQEGIPVYIDAETFHLVMSGPVPEGVKAAFISQYPHQMLAIFDHVLDTYYPDNLGDYANDPFPACTGDGVTVTQDPYVANYVRVRARDEQGRIEEFSLSRHSMEEIFNAGIEEEDFGKAISAFPYRLPEQARPRFRYLSREALVKMIREEPGMAQQEFARVYRVYMEPGQNRHAPTPPGIPAPIRPGPDTLDETRGGEMEGVDIPPLAPPLHVFRAGDTGLADAGALPAGTAQEEIVAPPARGQWIWIAVVLVLGAGIGALGAKRFLRT